MSDRPAPHTSAGEVDELDAVFPGAESRVNERIRAALRAEGILTLQAIAAEREEFFFCLPNLGKRSINST